MATISHRRILSLVLASAAGLMAFASCSPFASSEGAVVDASAEGATVADGSDSSATGDAGGPSDTSDASGFVEHFDEAGWEKDWTVEPPASLDANDGGAQSPPASLHVKLPPAATPRQISRAFDGARMIRAKMSFFIAEQGDGNVDFFSVSDHVGSGETGSVLFAFGSGTGKFLAELNQPGAAQTATPFSLPLSQWVPIELEVDLAARSWSVHGNGQLIDGGMLVSEWNPTTLFLKVGAPFTGGSSITSAWDVRIDDIEVALADGP